MPSPSRHARLPSYSTAVTCFALAIFAVIAVAANFSIVTSATSVSQHAVWEALKSRGNGLQTSFMRDLDDTWDHLNGLAKFIGTLEPNERNSALDAFQRNAELVGWMGFVDLDGKVVHATDKGATGSNVSHTWWFRHGLNGPSARTSPQTVQVASLDHAVMPAQDSIAVFAVPVPDAQGRALGVLSARISHNKANARFQQVASALNIDAVVVSNNGEALVQTPGTYASAALPSIQAAQVGVAGEHVETWPDGRSYASLVFEGLHYGNMPSLGWAMVASEPSNAEGGLSALPPKTIVSAAVALALVLIITLFFNRLYARPLTRLADSARGIAAGEEVYPFELRRTREIADLSAALGVLQVRSRGGTTPSAPRGEPKLIASITPDENAQKIQGDGKPLMAVA